jgi:heme-degrading monooxygenase HmoA
MILERATFQIKQGSERKFEADFATAREIALESSGCISVHLHRGIEEPDQYLVLIEWESVDAHLRVFRKSEHFERWAALLRPHYAGPPSGEHYDPVV